MSTASVDKYDIIEEIGRGGFAAVYKARDAELEREVALKVITAPFTHESSFVKRFRREARTAASLNHPNIVPVYEFGETDGALYLAMALIGEGRTLRDLLDQKGALSLERALPILNSLAAALDYLHQHEPPLTHRDVKPANVLLQGEGYHPWVVLTDFGLVRSPQTSAKTKNGSILGTLAYMAPEQANAERWGQVTPLTDVYALGVVTYEMLTGRPPFEGEIPTVLHAHAYELPPSPLELLPNLGDDLSAALLRALRKSPAERYPSAGAFIEALQGVTDTSEPEATLEELEAQAQRARRYDKAIVQSNDKQWAEACRTWISVLRGRVDYRDGDAAKRLLDDAEALLEQYDELKSYSRHFHRALELYDRLTLAIEAQAWEEIISPCEELLKLYPDLQGPQIWSDYVQRQLRTEYGQKEMVHIPAGKFLYGDDEETRELPEFWIARTPVTNAEYARFVAETDHPTPKHWEGKEPPAEMADHPVVNVSWHDAVAYAEWAGARLPTEEEWEKAARGTKARIYPWGDKPPTTDLCNFGDNVGSTTPVGNYSPEGDSPYRCVDMAGNVWEWTMSNHEKGGKVSRGGSFRDDAKSLRCAYPDWLYPDLRYENRGFRLARSSPP